MNKLILITGGSASGKTHLASKLVETLGIRAVYLSQDNFYKKGGGANNNYDEPAAFDFQTQNEAIAKMIKGEETILPIYDFTKHDVVGTKMIKPAEFIIFEGLFTFYDTELFKRADFKIFVDTPADTRLSRRLIRDTTERGRELESVINRWLKDVQPSYKKYISLIKAKADVVIPWEKLNERSIKSIIATLLYLDKNLDI